MLRKRENIDTFKAGMLSVGVHVVLLIALLISFNWKTTHPVNIAEVELWDSLPNTEVQKPLPPPEPVVKEEPKPVPKVEPVEKPKEVIKQEPQVDIALEKKKKELEKKREAIKAEEQLKKEKAQEKKAQLDALKNEINKDKPLKDKKVTQTSNDALEKIKLAISTDEKTAVDQQALGAKAAANAGVIGEYQNKIRTKIRGNVNKSLCGDGNPELKFDIGLLPTGQLSGSPKLIKSSGNAACDEAVERAIMASEPLPLPSDSSLFSQFRNLKLTFRPNDGS
jgi:colicin import membrane protein